MRVVIDLQPCQYAVLNEPAARWAWALLPELIESLASRHEVVLFANAEDPESVAALRRRVTAPVAWHLVGLPTSTADDARGAWLRSAASLMRDEAIAALEPAVELVLDAAAGWRDNVTVWSDSGNRQHATVLVLARALPGLLGRVLPGASSQMWEQSVMGRLRRADHILTMGSDARQSVIAAGVLEAKLGTLAVDCNEAVQQVVAAVAALAREPAPTLAPTTPSRPRLAYVSPLPPAASGIADYSAELLPALARYYEIELIVEQDAPVRADLAAAFPVRNPSVLRANPERYDRILYHFGNSPFHAHMVELLQQHRGTVVLHDFFLGHLFGFLQHSGRQPQALRKALFRSHGYPALAAYRESGEAQAIATYPCNLEILAQAHGVILHSTHACSLVREWYGAELDSRLHQTTLAHASPDPAARPSARAQARQALGLRDTDVLVCSFGYVGAGKLSRELVEAWQASALADDAHCRLVLVGGHQMQDDYARELRELVSRHADRIRITGYVDAATYQQYLAAADIAVQLRTHSRGETSRAVLDAMAHGLALIVNAHGAVLELPDGVALKLEDACAVADIAGALEACAYSPERRAALVAAADRHVRALHDPARVAATYRDAIEQGAQQAAGTPWERMSRVMAAASRPDWSLAWEPTRAEAYRLAHRLVQNHATPLVRRMLPDVDLRRLRSRAVRPLSGEWRGLILLPWAKESDITGSTERARHVARMLDEGGLAPECIHFDVAADADPLREDWDNWPARVAATLSDRLRDGRYRYIQLELPLLWPLYRDALTLAGHDGPAPCLIYASHRDEAATAAPAMRERVRAAEAELLRHADLVLAPHDAERQRLIRAGASPYRVQAFGNGGQLPEADWHDSEQVYRDYLPQAPYALIVSDGDQAALEGFFHYVGDTLAYLPPDAVLVIAGGLCERIQNDGRYQRWAGINGSRCVFIGRPDELGLAALRRHAHLTLLPRVVWPGDAGPDVKTAEALMDDGYVLTTSAALQGFEPASAQARVWVEDRPDRFHRALVSMLGLPALPRGAGSTGLDWHCELAGLPSLIRQAVVMKESASHE